MISPEQVCSYYSTLVSEQRLKVSSHSTCRGRGGALLREHCLCPVGRWVQGEEPVHRGRRGGGVDTENR